MVLSRPCLLFLVLVLPSVSVVLGGGRRDWGLVRILCQTSILPCRVADNTLFLLHSSVSGYLGMKVAVYSNVRTTVSAQKSGWKHCFNAAFRAGAVMGFALCGLGIFMLYVTLLAFRVHYPAPEDWIYLTECLTGYGLGGSSIAMFGRVGGGIYTKAADVGADLVGKVVHGIPEDDPRNPATIVSIVCVVG